MTFDNIVHSIPIWLNVEGPESRIVISSRVRLARNIKGIPYAHRANNERLAEIVDSVLDAADDMGFESGSFFRNDDLNDIQKNIFIERHLISPALASKQGNRGVLVKESECCSVMINEEDHLRLQSMRPGFDPFGALNQVIDIEEKMSKEISFSFSKEYGYLTACPTNMGTGLRASVLIHLPALVLTKEIQRVMRSAGQLGLAIRGYYGEGSDVIGNLFQISNQTSMGKTVNEIVEGLISVVKQIIEYEKRAADMLLKEAKNQIEDKVWRSIGILKTARALSTHEFMNLSSATRLAVFLGIVDKPDIVSLNELLVLTQPGHLHECLGRKIDPIERDVVRANLVRERFVDVKI